MEAAKEGSTVPKSAEQLKLHSFNDPIVIGASALTMGFVIGSGRWTWFNQSAVKIAQNLGKLALLYFQESIQKQNPTLFAEKPRITH